MPIGAFSARPAVWDQYIISPFLHTSTFGGNPLACAAALAAIEVIEQDNLCAQSASKGEYMLTNLQKLACHFPDVISDVRGKGLMIGVEFCHEGIGGYIMSEMVNRGVLIAYTLNNPKVIRLEPPLIIEQHLMDQVLAAFAAAVDRISLIARAGVYNTIKLEFADNQIHITSNNPEIGNAEEYIPAEIDGPDIAIAFNAQYIIDVLKNIDSKTCRIGLNQPLSPASIQEEDDDSFVYIVTPVRTNH